MPYIIFNGFDTRSLGLLIQKMPERRRAARQTETANPPGFDGALIMDGGAYDNYNTSFTVNCFGNCTPGDVFRVFYGEGRMITSDAPDRYRYVYCYGEASAVRDRPGAIYDSVTIPIICDPYEYETEPETLTLQNGQLIQGRGDADARPLIRITGAGSVNLMVGNRTLLIDGLTAGKPLYIDSGAKFAYVMNGDAMQFAYAAGVTVRIQTSKPDRWPLLNHSGATPVSWTGSAAVEITPNWRWL